MKQYLGKRCKMKISIEDTNGALSAGSKVKIEEYIDIEDYLTKNRVNCIKYNYSLDKYI